MSILNKEHYQAFTQEIKEYLRYPNHFGIADLERFNEWTLGINDKESLIALYTAVHGMKQKISLSIIGDKNKSSREHQKFAKEIAGLLCDSVVKRIEIFKLQSI